MVRRCSQSRLVYTDIINVALNYKCILYIKVAYINYLVGSLNIFIGKTLVFSFGIPFARLFIGGKLYYNSGLSLNRSIDLISIGL